MEISNMDSEEDLRSFLGKEESDRAERIAAFELLKKKIKGE